MTDKPEAKFDLGIPTDDDRMRRICTRCDFVDYQNPRIIAGSVVTKDNQILLCKRAIEPRKSFWTLPAGFMELGETIEEAAMREAMEEANAEIKINHLLATYSIPRIGQVQMMFRAELMSDISAGIESEEVAMFDWNNIPWANLAFPSVVWALTQYAQTRHQSGFAPFGNPDGTNVIVR